MRSTLQSKEMTSTNGEDAQSDVSSPFIRFCTPTRSLPVASLAPERTSRALSHLFSRSSMHVLCSVTRCNSRNLDSILQSCVGLRVQQEIRNHALLSRCARCTTATESVINLHFQSTPLLSRASAAYSFFIIHFLVGSLSCLIADCQ